MASFSGSSRFVIGLALLVPFSASLWMALVPETMSASTFAFFVTLVTATASIALNGIRNGGAAGSVGQLLHQVESDSGPRPRR